VNRRVLLIEDHEDCRTAMGELLETLGHVVQSAATGAEGVRKGGEFHPDVVVLDLGLPDMDGYELTRALRRQSASSLLIAFTGTASPADERRATAAGIDVFLVKPNGLTELIDTIAASAGEPARRKPAS
jgi:CheY-like chemotaxis protein